MGLIEQLVEAQRDIATQVAASNPPAWIVIDDLGINVDGLPHGMRKWHINYARLAAKCIDSNNLLESPEFDEDVIRQWIVDEISCSDWMQDRKNLKYDSDQTISLIKSRLKSLAAGSVQTQLKTISAKEIGEMQFQPIQFAVHGLIPEGLVVLAAPPKSGKSWMCLDLACSVATGNSFMGYPTTKGSVLYFAMEDTCRRINSRMNAMGIAEKPENLLFADNRTVQSLSGGLIGQLESWCKSVADPRLIIIDTMDRVAGQNSEKGNSYEKDTALYARLQEFAGNSGISVVVLKHKKKQGKFAPDDPFEEITGSMGLPGVADCLMLIREQKFAKDDSGTTLYIDGRDIERSETVIEFDKQTLHWNRVGTSEEVMKQKERNEYNTDPIVTVIKQKLHEAQKSQAAPVWIATVGEIAEACMKSGLKYTSREKVGKALSGQLEEQLYQYDGIVTAREHTRTGNVYEFSYTKQLI